jgi:hypothetical protein
MRRNSFYLFALLAIATVLYGCEKDSEPEDTSYKCQCGSMNWQGASFQLNDASRILWDDTLFTSREYYATAELRGGNQFLPANSLNLEMSFEDISQLTFFTEVDTFDVVLQEVNYGDPLNVLREFAPVEGTVSINPAPIGSPESVSFTFNMRQVVNGQFVGLPVPFSGSLTAE